MVRFLKYFLLCISLGISNLSYADESILIVKNHLKDIDVSLTTDLVCGWKLYVIGVGGTLGPTQTWYSTPLDQNPIKPSPSPVVATWQNCVIAEERFFGFLGDHNKIYVTLNDTVSGYTNATPYPVAVNSSGQTQEINFNGKIIKVSMTHSGNYQYRGAWGYVGPTKTLISFANG